MHSFGKPFKTFGFIFRNAVAAIDVTGAEQGLSFGKSLFGCFGKIN
jgi:hypothetical protein